MVSKKSYFRFKRKYWFPTSYFKFKMAKQLVSKESYFGFLERKSEMRSSSLYGLTDFQIKKIFPFFEIVILLNFKNQLILTFLEIEFQKRGFQNFHNFIYHF